MEGKQNQFLAGGEARVVEVARELQPDLIFIDLMMPRLNGYEVAQRLKSEHWARSALLVALTGWREGHYRERAQLQVLIDTC